ncbi:hypothetical protein CAPTEDRAFT_136787 [Capitella teleta]|uniref:Uncharacterized protein n=1 Tax=Capitella teleta TaxID=283909 RepID=R7U2E9_CAPTE|nr:hypothetical protein CAPTEDRAFT_136787 [Capitella teleta]|eukprot:ELU00515.1 hypothetical protein CAPTEDRAFT_136787 [Capitella teleta]
MFDFIQQPLPSDVESEVEGSGMQLQAVSKEDLYRYYCTMQSRSEKYKAKFRQVMFAYKDVERERDKLKKTLTDSQDKAFRRISELKEQTELDRLAKQHVEDNYQLMLQEKDELLKVLNTQVAASQQRSQQLQQNNSSTLSKASASGDASEEVLDANALKQKVKNIRGVSTIHRLSVQVQRLESLLSKCKETMKVQKDRQKAMTVDKQALANTLSLTQEELQKSKEAHEVSMGKVQSQMNEARRLIENLEQEKAMSVAQAKQQAHSAMVETEAALQSARQALASVTSEKDQLQERLTQLERKAQEQLTKSREIIKRLQDEKRSLQQEMEEKLQSSERSIEEDKEEMIQEALTLEKQKMQEEMKAEFEERIEDMATEHQSHLKQVMKEYNVQLEEKEREFQEALNQSLGELLLFS